MQPGNVFLSAAVAVLCMLPQPTRAIMQPATSMVLINEDDGGGSINVTNTDREDALLYVRVITLPDDKTPQLLVTQPVMRVNAGATQRVRFVLTSDRPLTHEHMKRVTFEGIPLVSSAVKNKVEVNIRQNLPVIIHPRGLAKNPYPWKSLTWSLRDGQLIIRNSGDWVVRITDEVDLLPAGKKVKTGKTYLLPGQTLNVPLPEKSILQKISKVRFGTVSEFGFASGEVEQSVSPL